MDQTQRVSERMPVLLFCRPRGLFSLAQEGSSAPRRGEVSLFASGGLFSFSSERKEEKKRRQKLRFWISLRGFTRFLSCQNKPRERCAAQISPKCCIVSASWSAAAFTLKCRRNRFCRGGGQRQRKEKQRCDFSAPSGRGLAARSADWGRERKAYYLSLRRFAPPPSQREAEDADCHGRDAPSQ